LFGKNITRELTIEKYFFAVRALSLQHSFGSPTREEFMHEALFPSHDEISRQIEIAKRLRAAFLHHTIGADTSRARETGNQRMFAAVHKNMGARHAFAIVAVVLVGLGVKLYFFSPRIAEARVVNMEIATMQATASPDMPRQELNDMAFGNSR
jgi:hypothetical protein